MSEMMGGVGKRIPGQNSVWISKSNRVVDQYIHNGQKIESLCFYVKVFLSNGIGCEFRLAL